MIVRNSLLAGIGLWLAAASAYAEITSLRATAEVNATVTLNGRKNSVDRVEVNLGRDRRFEVVFSGRNQRYQFTGEWSPLGDHRAILKIRSGNLASTSGEGFISVNGANRLESVTVKGKSKSGDFSASVNVNRPDDDDNKKNWKDFGSTVQGSGVIRFGSTIHDLRQFGARVYPDGIVDLFFQSVKGTDFKIQGRWFERRGQAYDILISDIDNASRIEARGVLTMNGRTEVSGIQLSGEQGKEPFGASFKAGKSLWPSGSSTKDWRFDSERKGSGELHAHKEIYDIGRARVRLNDNHTFEIRVWTTKEYVYSGTWKQSGNVANLTVTRGGLGSGQLRVNGMDWTRIDLDVIDGNSKFQIRFEAR